MSASGCLRTRCGGGLCVSLLLALYLSTELTAVVVAFEAAEHKDAGDRGFHSLLGRVLDLCPDLKTLETVPVQIGSDDGPAPVVRFNFPNKAALTYGDIVALAGDFWAKNAPLSMKKKWRSGAFKQQYKELVVDEEIGGTEKRILPLVHRVMHIVNEEVEGLVKKQDMLVRCSDKKCHRSCKKMKKCRKKLNRIVVKCDECMLECLDKPLHPNCLKAHRPKSFYDDGGTLQLIKDYFASDGRLLENALLNYDHFGRYAVKAYKIAHREAVRQAKIAGRILLLTRDETGAVEDMKKERKRGCERLELAIAANGFADHYYTDLFSSGHVRTPRYALEKACKQSPNMELERLFDVDEVLGSKPTKAMHDEDCINGLNVVNRLGDAWRSFGDKMYFEPQNVENRRRTVEGVAASLGEVLSAAESPNERVSIYRALELVPDFQQVAGLGNAYALNNPFPMFFKHHGHVMRRFSKKPYPQLDQHLANPYSVSYLVKSCNPLWESPVPEELREMPATAEEVTFRHKTWVDMWKTGLNVHEINSVGRVVQDQDYEVELKFCKRAVIPNPMRIHGLLWVRFVFDEPAAENTEQIDSDESVSEWAHVYHPNFTRSNVIHVATNRPGTVLSACQLQLFDPSIISTWCLNGLEVSYTLPDAEDPEKSVLKTFMCSFPEKGITLKEPESAVPIFAEATYVEAPAKLLREKVVDVEDDVEEDETTLFDTAGNPIVEEEPTAPAPVVGLDDVDPFDNAFLKVPDAPAERMRAPPRTERDGGPPLTERVRVPRTEEDYDRSLLARMVEDSD